MAITEEKRQPADGRETRACSRCAAPFHCGIDDPGGCWCVKLPPLPRAAYGDGGCLCEHCLREALRAETPPRDASVIRSD